MTFELTESGLALIKRYESLRLTAYLCPANKLTIGYGHVIKPRIDASLVFGLPANTVQRIMDECQSKREVTDECERLLRIYMHHADELLERDVLSVVEFLNHDARNVTMTQNQFDALVSFIFNIGKYNYITSTLREKHNSGDFISAAREFDRWVYATVGGKKVVLNGLIKRRSDERALYERH